MKKYSVRTVFAAIVAVGLVACSSGGGSSSTTPASTANTISGTAAAGTPIIGTVTIKDSSSPAKTKTATIAIDGSYSVDVSGMTAPFVLEADGQIGGNSYSLCSAATQADINNTINITPLTDLIIANIAGTIAQNYFASGNYSTLTAAQLNTQEAALQAALLPTLEALGVSNSIDLLRSSFSANQTGLDAALDIIKVSIDTSTNVATLTNIITQQTITNNISTGTMSGTLNNTTGVATGLSAIQAISSNLNTFSQLFASSLPSPSNTQLLALFDQATFLNDGEDLSSFLSDVTSYPNNIGISFTNVVIQSMNATQDAAVISFSVMQNGIHIDNVKNWNCILKNGVWLFQGDLRIASIDAYPRSIYSVQSAAVTSTGVVFSISDPGGIGITSADISGPGITGSITATAVIGNGGELRVPNSFDGILYGMTDAQIAQIPITGATYTISLYAGSNLLATYTETLSHAPYPSSQLTAANYITITAPTSSALSTFTSGNLSARWILPAGMWTNGVTLGMSNGAGLTNFYEPGVNPTATSITITVTQPSFTPTSRWFWVHGTDSNGVDFSTIL